MMLALAACSSSGKPGTIEIHAPAKLAFGTQRATNDLVSALSEITGRDITMGGLGGSCRAGEIHIVVRGHELPSAKKLAAQAYSIQEQRCADDGHYVEIEGGSHLAAQWGVYDFLERVGVRFFHPEQTLYPEALRWPAEAIRVIEAPAFSRRGLQAHRTHPIELSPPLGGSTDMVGIQKRWIDWNVKIRHTDVNGWDESLVGTYAWDRGFPRGAGLNLLSSQQGSRPVIDPDDPRPEHVQIAEAIDAQMVAKPGAPPVTSFSCTFNASEFTISDELLTVDRLTFLTTYINERWPDVEVRVVNHGTAQQPLPMFGVRFFDLSKFAPATLGVQVHPLMFYDLDRPAPVYGNADFSDLRNFIFDQASVRRIHYYPESSWWLTFDLPVPLYLAPVALEARDHDLALLAPLVNGAQDATTGVVGHLTFSSGQEWGYWLIDYCTARMTWDLELGWIGCIDHVTSAFEGGEALRDLLVEVGKAQVDPMRDPGVLAMLVGSDDETEAAAAAGIVFHPLPPRPVDTLGWDDARAASFEAASLAPLPAMATQYADWATRAEALVAAQRDAAAPFVREVVDGLRITGLRARHAHEVYASTLALRAAIASNNFAAVGDAAAVAERARSTSEEAGRIVAAREDDYRYPPELTIAGDEPGTDGIVPNATIYPYRYLSRTHRLFYWQRPDAQLSAMFGFDQVTVNDRILKAGTPLDVGVVANGVHDVAITWGDGTSSTMIEPHTYAAQGVYAWTADALHDQGAIHHEDKVAIVERRFEFPRGSLAITAPNGAALIEGLLPGLVLGTGTDMTGAFLALGRVDGEVATVAKGTVQARGRTGLTSAMGDLVLELRQVGTVTIYGAVITLGEGTGATDRKLAITGELATQEIIDLVVATGGFDAMGAREIVASTLGYTAETLPVRLPFTIQATGREPG